MPSCWFCHEVAHFAAIFNVFQSHQNQEAIFNSLLQTFWRFSKQKKTFNFQEISKIQCLHHMDRVKRIWYLSPMRAAKVQASLRIRAVSPEPPLLANASSQSRGTFRQKARSLAPLNGWACAVKICRDGMLEDTNSLDAAHIARQHLI